VNERIETECEIDRIIRNHRQGSAIIDVTVDMGINSETLAACFDTLIDAIHNP